MARIRTIKPEFFTSEDIVSLSPLARLLYIALWCEADREGRLVWKPRTFKLRYLPADDCSADDLCSELIEAGLVVLYDDGGHAYIPKFSRHQHINPRESTSVLPDPDEKPRNGTRKARVGTRHDASARVDDAQGGREGKGKEGEGIDNPPTPRTRGSAGDDGFDAFWMAYPNKTAKQAAAKAFAKLAPSADLLDEILQAVARQKTWPKWVKDGGQYIPHPATWLGRQEWLNEAPAVALVQHETPRQTAIINRTIEMTGGLMNVRQKNQPDYFDAIEIFPALG
jgi:hypothetical protein